MAVEPVVLEIIVNGAPRAVVQLDATSAATARVGKATEGTGLAMARTAKRGFLMNQMLFTARRLLYMVSLAAVGAAVAFVDWGFKFNSAMQQGRVILTRFTGSTAKANQELDHLFHLAAYSPFQFADLIKASAVMYAFGFTTAQTNRTMQDLVDALTATGRATPGALNRVSQALGHMMSMGTATGQVLQQLARDGIPGIYRSIEKYFGLSAQQAHHIGQLGIPSAEILKAIQLGIEDSKLHGLARKMQESTLHGVFTTFKDFVSQIMGEIEMRPFAFLQRMFNRINPALERMQKGFKKGGFKGMWEGLTQGRPTTLESDIQGLIVALSHVWKIVTGGLIPAFRFWFNILKFGFGFIKVLDSILGFLTKHMWLTRAALYALAYMFIVARLVAFAFFLVIKIGVLVRFIYTLYLINVALARYVVLLLIATVRLIAITAAVVAYTIATTAVSVAQWLWNAALVAFEALEVATGIFLIVAAITALVIGITLLIIHWREVVSFIKRHWVGIAAILGGPFIAMAYITFKIFQKLKQYIDGALQWIKRKAEAALGWIKKILNPFGIFSDVGKFFGGGGNGTMPAGTGKSLIPLPNNGKPFISMPNNGGLTINVNSTLNVDGKKMAQVVSQHKNDVRANQ